MDNYRDVIATQRNLEFFTVSYRFLIQVLQCAPSVPLLLTPCVIVFVCGAAFSVSVYLPIPSARLPPSPFPIHPPTPNPNHTLPSQVIPGLVVAPLYFAGKVELGVVSQSYSAFNHILADLSLIVNQFEVRFSG